MKALFTLLLNLAALLLFIPPRVSGQTFIYDFTGAANKVSVGTGGLGVGSIWLFSKIDATAKTDAVVTITAITGGLTLSSFDNTAAGGYDQAFQPTINVPVGNVSGYVQFQINFIKTGTYVSAANPGTALSQTGAIPATVLDDDGTVSATQSTYEFDALNMGTNQAPDYDASGGQLSYSTSAGFFTGTNTTGTNYSGISTTATAVMFTVLNSNITTMTWKTGVTSSSTVTPAGRVASLAFYMPPYPNAVLASSPIAAFNGVETANAVRLNWQLAREQGLDSLDLERAINGGSFAAVRSYALKDSTSYSFTDAGLPSGAGVGYRLKASSAYGESWYSDVIHFSMSADTRFSIYPNPVINTLHVTVSSATSASGTLQLLDYSGRVVWRQQVNVNKGTNDLYVQRPASISSGNYIVVLQAGNETWTQKIMLATVSS